MRKYLAWFSSFAFGFLTAFATAQIETDQMTVYFLLGFVLGGTSFICHSMILKGDS